MSKSFDFVGSLRFEADSIEEAEELYFKAVENLDAHLVEVEEVE